MNDSLFTVEELSLRGVFLLTPRVFMDNRGFFSVTFHDEFMESIGARKIVQGNSSRSTYGVLRGLHYQKAPHAQAKIVRCTYGEIVDVAADHNIGSPTFGEHVSVVLSGDTQKMLYIPSKYCHGFCVTSDVACVEYSVDEYYSPEASSGVRFDDPIFKIKWPEIDKNMSPQDLGWRLTNAP